MQQTDCLGDPRVAQPAHQTGGRERAGGTDGLDKKQLNHSRQNERFARAIRLRFLFQQPDKDGQPRLIADHHKGWQQRGQQAGVR